jgi:hypothetical protein
MLRNGRRAFLAAAAPTRSHGQLYWPRHASASAPTYASHIMLTIPGSSAVSCKPDTTVWPCNLATCVGWCRRTRISRQINGLMCVSMNGT